jgi:hypothetical protein
MNLIEMSEQLKDVPDELLMKEVQSPSGAYPSYLIVTEMGRRKRMRDQARREMPTTTVTQDLMPPSREQMMMAAAAAQRQTMPPMAQPMSQLPQGLNAPGIMAAPQAMNTLAAQDVMGAQEPRRMAAGGMVSFAEGGDIKYDDRGVARFQGGAYLFPEGSLLGQFQRGTFFGERTPGSLLGRYQLSMQEDPDVRRRIEEEEERKRQRAENDAELRRIQNRATSTQTAAPIASPPPVATPSAASTAGGGGAGRGAGGGGRGGDSAAPPAAPYAFAIPAYSSKFADQTRQAREALLADQPLTEEQEGTAREKGVAAYKQQVPFRMGFLEQDIAKRQSDLEGRRGSNINEAIIQAGLGIMGSKSPYFAQAVSEGGLSALGAYRQGLKDIREGEKDLMQSKVSFANAQTLYDQGKFAAGDKERQNAIERQQRGFEKKSSLYATFTKETQMELDAHRAEVDRVKAIEDARQKQQQIDIEREKLPATIDALRGQAAYYRSGIGRGGVGRLSDADQKAAEDEANRLAMMDKTVKYGTPEFIARRNQYYLQELQRRAAGLGYQPGGTPPAGGTGAEFIGFR